MISQIGKTVFGDAGIGGVLFGCFQVGTMLILVLAANTSFADFPRLASFHAGDNFMPRQLTKRGHRLVFSNGIISLAVAAIVLLIVTDAQVDRLIPLYAIGVFLSFTLSQAGMAKHHLTNKEPGWQVGPGHQRHRRRACRPSSAWSSPSPSSAQGAWVIIVLVPMPGARCSCGSTGSTRPRRRSSRRTRRTPPRRRSPTSHVVIVLVDSLDMAAARAIQYARTLTPDELAGRALRPRPDPHRGPDRGVEPARLRPAAARRRRVPRPPHRAIGRRARRPQAASRATPR